jgi:predicted DsbA family dithiol-disulfide isomerase
MKIEVFSDPVCPWCFIGKKRLEAAMALRPNNPVSLRWRAFQLNPDMAESGMDRRTYLNAKFGGEDRANEVYRRITEVGHSVGIDFRFDQIRTTPNTIQAHRLIGFAQRPEHACGDAVIQGMFEAYFLQGRNIGETAVLQDIAVAAGIDSTTAAAYLANDEDREDIVSEDIFARRLGINGVPCFIIDGKFTLSGAQEPESFMPLFDLSAEEQRHAPESASP